MRIIYIIAIAFLMLSLCVAAHYARRSRRAIGRPVMLLILALLPPMLGNLILIASTQRTLSVVGCYIYFIGMDLVMLALLHFTRAYCNITRRTPAIWVADALLILDALQLLANSVFGHAFGIEMIEAYGAPYFRLVPFAGQTVHRIIVYGVLAGVLVVFIVKLIRSPRINSERYSVILATMIVTTLWQTYYIFSRTPMDRSMIGFGVFGLLVYFFSLHYRPLRLLDSMLATVASEIPDALFFFDLSGRCIWANKRGIDLAEIKNGDFDQADARLEAMFGDIGADDSRWSGTHITGSGDAVRSYVLDRRTVTDHKGRGIGSFLSIRDNSAEQKTLQREIYNATHDSLTQVYNRAGYDLLISRIDLASTLMLLVDVDEFKQINDVNGHEVGDRTLRKIARTIEHNFRADDYICRIGGDEFIVLMLHTDESQYAQITQRIERINAALADTSDGLPSVSVSAGVARGDKNTDPLELFERADRALYDTKRAGRHGLTFADA